MEIKINEFEFGNVPFYQWVIQIQGSKKLFREMQGNSKGSASEALNEFLQFNEEFNFCKTYMVKFQGQIIASSDDE